MDKWIELVQHLRGEPSLVAERINVSALREACREDRIASVEYGGIIIAFAALWKTPHPGWWEVGTIWVRPEFRGNGLSRTVFTIVLDKLRQKPGNGAFLITHDRGIINLATRADWHEASWESGEVPSEVIQGRRFRSYPDGRHYSRRLYCYKWRIT